MPRGKKAATQETATKTISKTKAVKQALAKLGQKAKPAAISEFAKTEFGLEISIGHVSNIKSTLKKANGKGHVAALNGAHAATKERSTSAAASATNGKNHGHIAIADSR
jgi:hypothetical protein